MAPTVPAQGQEAETRPSGRNEESLGPAALELKASVCGLASCLWADLFALKRRNKSPVRIMKQGCYQLAGTGKIRC